MLGCVRESRLAIRAIASVARVSLQAMLTSPLATSGVLSSVFVLSSRSESSRARLRSRCPALVREMPWPPRSSSLQSKLVFQLDDLAGKRRLAYVQLLCRAGDVAGLGYGDKSAEVPDVHVTSLL